MNNDDFIVTPKNDKTVTLTIRIPAEIAENLDKLSQKSNRSRNELINMALNYALENVKFVDYTENE
ncbi:MULTISPECIES: CopG family transcriptional regulator [unclassified Lysinibacillus]|uniref:ribbon-helix-helix domain-containing protein n=1 Tax=unclassified Lysinibacillus TaxID=2636778 RepID=UPI0008918B4A|nr:MULTISPECIES: CopG family transcriptional regulator [unclassified Lysinibacillus]SCY87307.1 Ribbon-helix-helix protein, copG family [Lysinibacillus sp. SG9]SDB38401.1 Ribbon-helix-helix protein, copG family [Lysinibacillus sp. TC-37]SFT02439.1 Ribbon-helix-helix protein, copG family [Lysinibacillus sp. SG55]